MAMRAVFGGLALLMMVGTWATGSAHDEPGQRIYEGKCRHCHGEEGRGGKGPALIPFEWSDQRATELIRRPVCDMPPIPASELSDAEVAQIAAYLRRIK